jgi:uncharacterized lipoprotein
MRHSVLPIRSVAIAALAVAVLGASGCSWFRKGSELYAQSPESRPLEVPPDLNQPDTSGAMKMPDSGSQSVSRSSMPAPAASVPNNTGFTVPGERDAVFAKVGDALAATAGVTIASKAQILGTYDVDYEGTKFLLRVTKVEAGAYISAVDPRGLPASGAAPMKLIAALKAALGAG